MDGSLPHEPVASREERRVLRRGATRAVFATAVFFAPAPFWMLFVVGLVPLSCLVVLFGRVIAVAEPDGGGLLARAILLAHVLVDGAILYVAATVICRLLFALCPPRVALTAVALLLAVLVIASFFPIYLFAGDTDVERFTLWRVWRMLVIGDGGP